MKAISVDVSDGVGTITLIRPQKRNSMNPDFTVEFLQALRSFEHDDKVQVIMTIGTETSFCAGADYSTLNGMGEGADPDALFWDSSFGGNDELVGGSRAGRKFDIGIGRWVEAIMDLKKPRIAAVNGDAVGGGLGLACLHDYRIGAESARFRTAFVGLGVGPDTGVSWFLPRIVGHAAASRMMYRNNFVHGPEALEIGLISEIAPDDQFADHARALAVELAGRAPLGLMSIVQSMRQWSTKTLDEQLRLEWECARACFTSNDASTAMDAFLNKKEVTFIGG